MSEIQVQPEHYADLSYDTKQRFISYWHQLKEVYDTRLNSVLEVGVGNGFVSDYLKQRGFNLTSLDIDENLHPDVVGSVTELPFDDNEFELTTCFEVLEHLPFEQVKIALEELKRVSSSMVILSLPDRTLCYKGLVKLPVIKERSVMISVPGLLSKEHTFDGQHHWELGKKNYPVSRFRDLLSETGFTIRKSYRIFEVTSHHFFILDV